MTVLIVGAGPTGLVLAALLARRGVACTVIDRRPHAYPLPRAVHLDDEAMRVLQQVGVAARLPSRPGLGLRLVDPRLRPIAQFDRSPDTGRFGYPQANMIDQPELERLLHEQVTVRRGTELVGLATGVATLLDAATGTTSHCTPSFVLGCDGADSSVRALLGTGWRDLGFRERWLVVDARHDRPLGTWDGVWQVCDPARAATYMQVGPDRYRWEFRLHEGETADDLDLDELLRPWGVDPQLEVLRAVEYVFRAGLATQWRLGTVLLLGDAAHLTPPFIGQGLGMGLRDAGNLAWKLAAVLDGAPAALLDTYQSERAPHAEALIRTAITVGWALTGGQDAAAAVRRTALALLCRAPRISRAVLDRGTPAIRPGPLVGRGRHPRALAGQLIPQPQAGLDEQLGKGFALVVAGPVGADLRAAARSLGAQEVPATGEMRRWLRGASAVLVRPDRLVLAATDRRGALSRDGRRAVDACLELAISPEAPRFRA